MRLKPAARGVLAVSLSGLILTSLGACAEDRGPADYAPWEQGAVARVDEGVVVSSRYVEFGPNDPAAGTVIGGVGGAVIGSALAGRGSRGAGAVLGAVGGAILGTAIASSDRRHGFAYTIRRRDGRLIEIAQADAAPIANGTRVTVSFGPGRRARVAPFNGYGPPPPPGAYGPPPGGYPPPPPPPPG